MNESNQDLESGFGLPAKKYFGVLRLAQDERDKSEMAEKIVHGEPFEGAQDTLVEAFLGFFNSLLAISPRMFLSWSGLLPLGFPLKPCGNDGWAIYLTRTSEEVSRIYGRNDL